MEQIIPQENNNENNNENNKENTEIQNQEKLAPPIKVDKAKSLSIKQFQKYIFKFFTDVSVVVIGIMLSLWLNDIISSYNQQKDVKTFLLGLKADFEQDVLEIENDMLSYRLQKKTFSYLSSLKVKEIISPDSLKKHSESLFNFTGLVINNGRYEGFKSAGKLGNISDHELQNDIVNLYQEDLSSLLLSTNVYTETKRKFIDFISENQLRITDSTSNLKQLLITDRVYFLARNLSGVEEILGRYQVCAKKMRKIIARIKEIYK